MEHRTNESTKQQRFKQKHKRTQWLIASTWITTMAAFVGFFAIWNHLGSAGAAGTSQYGRGGRAIYSGDGRHQGRDYGFEGQSGNGSSFGGGSGFGGSGSTQANPGQSSGQFVTRAS